uniref:(northern house mosquito) hypothetical protein n=1 Tax=Culex pipiens TaxID=7175 RepID=A0A8D8LEM9_CULPI
MCASGWSRTADTGPFRIRPYVKTCSRSTSRSSRTRRSAPRTRIARSATSDRAIGADRPRIGSSTRVSMRRTASGRRRRTTKPSGSRRSAREDSAPRQVLKSVRKKSSVRWRPTLGIGTRSGSTTSGTRRFVTSTHCLRIWYGTPSSPGRRSRSS